MWTKYRYGKFRKKLLQTVGWLVINKKKIIKKKRGRFDYPDYWGLPRYLAESLSPDEVDWIQENTWNWTEDF